MQLHAADGSGTSEMLMLKPENLVLATGSIVRLEGLNTRVLNGRMGTVASFDTDSGRYTVRVAGEARPKRIIQINCRLVFTI